MQSVRWVKFHFHEHTIQKFLILLTYVANIWLTEFSNSALSRKHIYWFIKLLHTNCLCFYLNCNLMTVQGKSFCRPWPEDETSVKSKLRYLFLIACLCIWPNIDILLWLPIRVIKNGLSKNLLSLTKYEMELGVTGTR